MSRELAGAIFTKIDTEAQFPLGSVAVDASGRKYRYVRWFNGSSGMTAVAGFMAYGVDTADGVWDCASDGDSTVPKVLLGRPMGQLQAVMTDGTYGWVQFYGINKQAFLTTNAVAQDEILIGTTNEGEVDGVAGLANVTAGAIGTALEDDSGTALAAGSAFLDCYPGTG